MKMKRSLKVLGVTLALACVFSAYAAASSFASEFYYKGSGTKVTGTQTVTGGLQSGTKATLSATLSGVPVTITCSSASQKGSLFNSGGAGHVSGLTISFTSCITNAPHCSVSNVGGTAGTINTNSLKGVTEGEAVKFEPTTGTEFVGIEFHSTGGTCAFTPGNPYPVTGYAKGTAENSTGRLKFTSTSGTALKLGPATAKFVATFEPMVGTELLEVI